MDYSKYFDWAATSPADKEILEKSLALSMEYYANPSAVHSQGQEARKAFENARKLAANALGVRPEEVYFTSGGTESDHIPLLSVLNRSEKGRIIISGIEHPALREQCNALKKLGYDVVTVNPDKNGFITPESIAENITGDTVFVTVMAVNNETGCIQPVYEIADAVTKAANGKRKAHFHVDCVQAAGKVPLDLSYSGIDSAALSAHKSCGPHGIGILYLKKDIKPFLTGGGQEKNIRSGTENLFGAHAFALCLEKYYFQKKESLTAEKKSDFELHSKLCSGFISELTQIKGCTLVPEIRSDLSPEVQEKFSPYVVQAAFKGIPGNVMVRALDSKGFSISTGSACSAKKQSRPILQAMNVKRDIQDTAVRFSFGPLTEKKDIDELICAVKEVAADFN